MTELRKLNQAGFAQRQLLRLAVIAMVATTVSCGPPATQPASGPVAANTADDYLTPPMPMAVQNGAMGLRVVGLAGANSRVRLTAIPSAVPEFARADPAGNFAIVITASAVPRLYALAMEIPNPGRAARVVQAQGYLFIAPNGRAALLRAGGGSQLLGPTGGMPTVQAMDYDRAGGAVLSGVAPAGMSLNAQVDGVTRGHATATAEGRYRIPLEPISGGEHQFVVSGGSTRQLVRARIADAAPLTQGPFRAERTGSGWRIDWMTPGGGLQTSLIMD